MKCKILKEIGTLTKTSKGAKKLQLIEWDGRPAVYDLRTWLADGKATSGVTFSKEDLLRIVELVEEMENDNDEDEDFPINPPVEDDDDEVIFTKATKKAEPKKTEVKEEKAVEVAKTDTHYTYDDCIDKLDEMFGEAIQSDAYRWLLGELKEKAKEDDTFRQNLMRKSKTIDGVVSYCQSQAFKDGTKLGNSAVLDQDMMLEICIDYFNAKEVKKSTETKTSTKTTKKTTTTKKLNTKKTTSKKATRVVKPLEIYDDEE